MSKNEINKKLYLDREKFNSIPFLLNDKTTIDALLKEKEDELKSRINSLYKKNIEDCNFLIIETKAINKKDDIPSLMEFRANKNTKLYELLQNPQNNLYFLPKRESNIKERQKARDTIHIQENCFEEAETNYFLTKPNEEFISKVNFYLYDFKNQILTKEKGSVDKNKITIFKNGNRDTIEILIKDIIKDLYYTDITNAPYRKNLPIKGDRPKFYIELVTNKETFFFCQYKDNLNYQWENAIKKAINKYKNFNLELNLDIKINSSKTSLYVTHHSIIANCFTINKILFNNEKRKMFFSDFPDKKIGAIASNIISYKDFIKKNQYLDAWMRFKEIFSYIESYKINNQKESPNRIINEEDKINDIFTEERFNNYKKVAKAADENVKKIKIEESSLFLFKNEIKIALSDILKEDLFDDIFFYLYELYVLPYFEEINKILKEGSIPTEKPLIRQKFQFLSAIYFNQIISNMNSNDYNLLYSKLNQENEQINSEQVPNQVAKS